MQTLIDQLNKMALHHSEGEVIDLPAIRRVIDDFGLEFVATDANEFGEEACRIFETADGTLINCWVYSPNRDGLGFDDQVNWFVGDLITQAAAADIAGVSISAVGEAVKKGRLRGYKNPNGKRRQAGILVSEAEVRGRWS